MHKAPTFTSWEIGNRVQNKIVLLVKVGIIGTTFLP